MDTFYDITGVIILLNEHTDRLEPDCENFTNGHGPHRYTIHFGQHSKRPTAGAAVAPLNRGGRPLSTVFDVNRRWKTNNGFPEGRMRVLSGPAEKEEVVVEEEEEEDTMEEYLEDWNLRRKEYQEKLKDGEARVTADKEFMSFFRHERFKDLQDEFERWNSTKTAEEFASKGEGMGNPLSYDRFDPVIYDDDDDDDDDDDADFSSRKHISRGGAGKAKQALEGRAFILYAEEYGLGGLF
eukprot:jgi/Bigna1/135504/aug1.29_g10212